MAKRSSMRARLTNSALGLLAAGTVAVGVLALDLGAVEAGEIQLAGTLSQHPDGYLAFETDSTTYAVVAGMYTAPYLGRAVTVGGAIEAGTLYVSELTVGAIHLQDQAGSDVLQTTGTVEKSTDGYQVTVEGVVFTLIGSDQFDQVVGQKADIGGELTGTTVAVNSLRTADGKEIETRPPNADDVGDTAVDGSTDPDDEWGDQN